MVWSGLKEGCGQRIQGRTREPIRPSVGGCSGDDGSLSGSLVDPLSDVGESAIVAEDAVNTWFGR